MDRLEELRELYDSHRKIKLCHYYINPGIEISTDEMIGELFEKIERLKKEKEWLIKQSAKTLKISDDDYSEILYQAYIKREMQRALKESK